MLGGVVASIKNVCRLLHEIGFGADQYYFLILHKSAKQFLGEWQAEGIDRKQLSALATEVFSLSEAERYKVFSEAYKNWGGDSHAPKKASKTRPQKTINDNFPNVWFGKRHLKKKM